MASTTLLLLLLMASPALAGPAESARPAFADALPARVSLYPTYGRYQLAAQAQKGDTCWAYSIIGCLELELSRSRRAATPLSPFYLVWAAARSDRDTFDPRGSNFGRAARALERFGVAPLASVPPGDENAPLSANLADPPPREAAALGRGIVIDWIRFWRNPPGWTDEEMTAVKRRLAEGHPVAVGMRWPKQLTVEDKSLCLLGTCRSLDETFDGHCVTLVGYEDSTQYQGGGAFLIRNTWGPGWMQDGYGRMSYAYMRSFANDALSFHVDKASPAGPWQPDTPPGNLTTSSVTVPDATACKADRDVALLDDNIGRFCRGRWQGDRQLLCKATGAGAGFELSIKVPTAGSWRISLASTKAPDYGIWQVSMDGKPLGTALDFGWPNVEPTGEFALGEVHVSEGRHTLRFECKGKSMASSGCFLGLNWIRIQAAR